MTLLEVLTPERAYGLTQGQHAHSIAPTNRGRGLERAELTANKLRRLPQKYANVRLAPAVDLKTGEPMDGYEVILYDDP